MDRAEALGRLAESRVGHLATVDAGGLPHVVPFVFAVDGATLYSAVDRKPKRTGALRRLDNIRAHPNVQVVVDHYDEDWNALWWVRASGPARILDGGDPEEVRALGLLAAKYPQYVAEPPGGPVIAVEVVHLRWWEGGET